MKPEVKRSMKVFRAGNYYIDFRKKTVIMGILNVTPDSFSDGGMWYEPDKAVNRAFEIQHLGADILDVGAQSTRPGFKRISAKEEWERLRPVLERLEGKISIPISVDTFYPEVAEKALKMGVNILNDVSGFRDVGMLEVVAESNCGVVLMHSGYDMRIRDFFEDRILELHRYGVNNDRICLDPGIGFKLNRVQDRFIINNLNNFRVDNLPFLVGASRKRLISECCGNTDHDSLLLGTVAINTLAIAKGANILRVHDVKESILAARIAESVLRG